MNVASRTHRMRLYVGLTGLALVSIAVALQLGASGTSWADLWSRDPSTAHLARDILIEIRLPRVLLAAIFGAALSAAGVAFQALLRNPLADPFVIGVSGGASLGGVVALVAGTYVSWLGFSGVVIASATLGALATLVAILRLATRNGTLSVFAVLLTGAVFNAFCGAIIMFLQSVASDRELHEIVFYLMGRIPSFPLSRVGWLGCLVAIALLWLSRLAADYNILALGEEAAEQTGVDVERVKLATLLLGASLVGLVVAVSGLIGFVGLIVPHVLRLIIGPDHRVLLPASMLAGAVFLVLADATSRSLLAPQELPVGVITALLGGPVFLLLIRSRGLQHGS